MTTCNIDCIYEKSEVIGHMPIEGRADGINPDIELRVVKGDNLVQILPNSKNLVLERQLDRDQGQAKFEILVECRSRNLDSDFSQLNISVFVTIQDVNDNPPVFDAAEYNITIKEELPIDTIIFTDFEATDRDQPGPNSLILYSIEPGPYSDLLQITDPFRPVVTVKNRIDYEKLRSFDVILEARDQGEPSMKSSAPLHVTVEDVNDRPPYFQHQYYTSRSIMNDEVIVEPEAIKACDGDELKNRHRVWESSNHFSIDEDGKLSVKVRPLPPRATFFIYAREKSNLEKNATAIFSLVLEKTLRFEYDSYSIKVTPSLPLNVVLLTVKAFSTQDSVIRYSLESADAVVSIGEATGQLTFSGFSKTKTGIIQYELLATNRNRDTSLWTEMELFAFSKNSRPPCGICELVVLATRDDGATSVAKIIVKNPSTNVPSSSMLAVMVLILIAFVLSLLVVFVFRKMHYVWRNQKRTNICWMNNAIDTGITISGTIPGSTSRHYVVNADKEKNFEDDKIAGTTTNCRSPSCTGYSYHTRWRTNRILLSTDIFLAIWYW
ncbi:hypothetical protein KIN20_009164 [Parelaphostrongylus tenuis]|uniref:Cadherin domain-containing protein n=1 Tax=Parelaphostrongylus tenuis TaxID=148309 RepID=A0AAD5MAS1_PARTN|nr:hypothetical protein KIN20_009164 [Parelaphostrongylus tenuis]